KPVWKSARALRRILQDRHVRILHCHNTYADLVGLVAAKWCRIPCVTTLYVWGDFGFKRGVLQWIDARLLPYFDRITAHCETTRQQTLRMGFSESEVTLLPCGFEGRAVQFPAEERSRRRAEFGVGPQETVLIYVARFWPEKAHEVVLEGMKEILRHRPATTLWLLGVGPEEPRIRSMVREMNLEEKIRFLGFRSDLEEMLALADIMVHPSHMEGVPLAVLSGMAAGLPVVATRVGGLPEIVRHGETGVLIPPREPSVLAREVIQLIDHPEARRRFGQAARRFVETEYSLQEATNRVHTLYAELLAAQRNSRGALPAGLRSDAEAGAADSA
ncbi:MAG TPA: glycosyltransferase family 4 protein, partial [Terriglobia bacterium]|nr:glycosyltransferase family 4 protein [Terriglobia bacterium]